jgi:hypothetical protein
MLEGGSIAMSRTVFFSWQDDRAKKEGRNLIERALEIAVSRIAKDTKVEEAVRDGLEVDKDTKGVPGSPPIFPTILDKIDRAAIFVPDLTFVGTRPDGRATPNPNVLIEYGWALKSLGYFSIVPVMNEAHGAPTRQSLPFDLASFRFPITYNVPDAADDATRRAEREQLAKSFEAALKGVFESTEFRKRQETAPIKPDLSIRLVHPASFALVIHNDSSVVVREVKHSYGIWNLDKNVILPIPIAAVDWIRPGEYSGPFAVVSLPTVAPLIKEKDRLFGFIGVSCPECLANRFYWVYAVSGEGGWYSRIPDGKGPALDRLVPLIAQIRENPDRELSFIPEDERIPILSR